MKLYAPIPSLVSVIVGVAVTILGIILNNCFPKIISSIIAKKLALGPDSQTLPLWRDVPIPIYTKFYIFNYTNSDDFLENWNSGVKPIVEQLGPYTYRQYRQKKIVKWDDVDDTVYYKETKTYYFVPEMSSGSEDDLVNIPNIPLQAIVQLAPETEKRGLKAAIQMTNTTEFVEQTVGSLLFYGYRDDLVDLIQYLTGQEILPGAMFGVFYGRNGSDDGVIRIKRGNQNSLEFGQITRWNNDTMLQLWNGSSCNKIHGTDGTIYHPNIQKDETLTLFNFDACRSLYVRFQRDSEYRGIPTYRFSTDLALFADVNMNPDNMCYCHRNAVEHCSDAGVMSLAPCKEGAPVFMSFPHFLMANHKTRFAIDGLDPNPDKHKLFIDIEPNAGCVMKVAARIQLNVQMKPIEGIEGVENLPDILLPVLWMDENAELSNEVFSFVSSQLSLAKTAISVVPLLILILGLILASLGILCSFGLMFKSNKTKVLPLMGEEPYVKPSRGYFNAEFKN